MAMEYRVHFYAEIESEVVEKAERVEAANPLNAVNSVLGRWYNVVQIEKIEAFVDDEGDEADAFAQPGVSKVYNEITVEIQK